MYRRRHLEGIWRGLASRCKLETAYALREDAMNFFFLTPNEILWKKRNMLIDTRRSQNILCKSIQEKKNLRFNQIFKEVCVKP